MGNPKRGRLAGIEGISKSVCMQSVRESSAENAARVRYTEIVHGGGRGM